MDEKDVAILAILQREHPLNKALAERVGLSPSACLERVRRLERRGVIEGYGARINPGSFAPHVEGWAAITLRERTPSAMQALAANLAEAEIVTAAYELSAPYDFIAHVLAPRMADWRSLEAQLEKRLSGRVSIRFAAVLSVQKRCAGVPESLLATLKSDASLR